MELYREDGRKAGLYDVCDWWIETYPSDVFVNEPKVIIEARRCMQNILIKRVRVIPSSNKNFTTSLKVCPHCNMDIAIRNPSGYCDHLYYPNYCEVCEKREVANK